MWTWDDRSLTELTDSITQIVDTTIAEGIALQPTIQVLYCEQDIHNPDYLEDPRLSNVLPANLIDWYHTSDGQWWRQRMLEIPIVAQIDEIGTVEVGKRADLLLLKENPLIDVAAYDTIEYLIEVGKAIER